MLHILTPTFKPVNDLICGKAGLMWVVKCATSLFNSICSNVLCGPFYCTLSLLYFDSANTSKSNI